MTNPQALWTSEWPTVIGYYWVLYRHQGPLVAKLFRSVLTDKLTCDVPPGVLLEIDSTASSALLWWSERIEWPFPIPAPGMGYS